jgi:hypothetical protein
MNKFVVISLALHFICVIVVMFFSLINPHKIDIDSLSYIDIVYQENIDENKTIIVPNSQKNIQKKTSSNNKQSKRLIKKDNLKIQNNKNTKSNQSSLFTTVDDFLLEDEVDNLQQNQKGLINKDNSDFKDFEKFLDSNQNSQDLSSEESELTKDEKNILSSQIKQCWVAAQYIKDKNIEIVVHFTMNENRTIKDFNIDILNITNTDEINSIKNNLNKIFTNTDCKKLLLPNEKFSYWKKFSIKLNLKGFF